VSPFTNSLNPCTCIVVDARSWAVFTRLALRPDVTVLADPSCVAELAGSSASKEGDAPVGLGNKHLNRRTLRALPITVILEQVLAAAAAAGGTFPTRAIGIIKML